MVTKFAVADWRSIMRICGSISATCRPEQITCRYILLRFDVFECVAYGSNGTQITRISVPCTVSEVPAGYQLMVLPMKVPARTKFVELDIDEVSKNYTVSYIDEDNDIIDAQLCNFFDGEPMDYEYYCNKTQDTISQYGYGEGKYVTFINPKILINALDGFKSCDYVILNFADRFDPFTIRSYDDDRINTLAIVNPARFI